MHTKRNHFRNFHTHGKAVSFVLFALGNNQELGEQQMKPTSGESRDYDREHFPEHWSRLQTLIASLFHLGFDSTPFFPLHPASLDSLPSTDQITVCTVNLHYATHFLKTASWWRHLCTSKLLQLAGMRRKTDKHSLLHTTIFYAEILCRFANCYGGRKCLNIFEVCMFY